MLTHTHTHTAKYYTVVEFPHSKVTASSTIVDEAVCIDIYVASESAHPHTYVSRYAIGQAIDLNPRLNHLSLLPGTQCHFHQRVPTLVSLWFQGPPAAHWLFFVFIQKLLQECSGTKHTNFQNQKKNQKNSPKTTDTPRDVSYLPLFGCEEETHMQALVPSMMYV